MVAAHSRPLKTRKQTKKRPAPRMLPRARVAAAVKTMAAPSGSVRFGAGKALAVTAEKDPARVYPHFDAIAGLLAGESKVVRWNALQIIARLVRVDAERKVDAWLDAYLAFIRGDNLISAANAIQGAAQIGHCRPDLIDRIVPAILAVERATYDTDECRNVAIGHVLDALEGLGSDICRRPEPAAFIRRQKKNTRPAVARHAERMTADLANDASAPPLPA